MWVALLPVATTLLHGLLSRCTAGGEAAAVIDVTDSFDPGFRLATRHCTQRIAVDPMRDVSGLREEAFPLEQGLVAAILLCGCYSVAMSEREGEVENSSKSSAEGVLPAAVKQPQQSALSAQTSLSEDEKRTRIDFALAICICLVAAIFWFWDSKPGPNDIAAQPVSRPASPQLTLAAALNNQGSQLYRAGDYAGAEAIFRKAVAADPQDALSYCNLGAALIPQQRYDEAIAALQRSIALDPSSTLTRNNLKWALDEKTKHKQ